MSDYPINNNNIRVVEIEKIVDETPRIKTFYFRDKLCQEAKPGHFLMVWLPRVDEIPLSVSGVYSDGLISVTVAKVGEATETMHNLKLGSLIGVRGPLGNCFEIYGEKTLIAGGGTGIAPLAFLSEKLAENSREVTFLMGAKSAQELLFLERIKKALSRVKSEILVLTEDGSLGFKGMVTDQLDNLLREQSYDVIYACGPEPMIRKVFLAAEKYGVPLQASLERIIRCGMGVCGSCVIGGYRVCRDGPVFDSAILREIKEELGVKKLDFNGKRIHL